MLTVGEKMPNAAVTDWKPSPQPSRYDQARVAQMQPIEAAIDRLDLPLNRLRKLRAILNALTMQIEDGGDSPMVNAQFVAALRAGVLHQVDEQRAASALRAIDAFEHAEEARWEQVRAGTLPPIGAPLDKQITDLVHEAYHLLNKDQCQAACDRWLAAWTLVKALHRPEMRTADRLQAVYRRDLYHLNNWCFELLYELHNAGLGEPSYAEHRITFAQEFLAFFPDESDDTRLEYRRAIGEALWRLGRYAEAEAFFAATIEMFPDLAWAYISWADQYWLWDDSRRDYARGEALLRRALERPNLDAPGDIHDRLNDLYKQSGRLAELGMSTEQVKPPALGRVQRMLSSLLPEKQQPARVEPPPKRNDPCWCGSGKKYKHCHMKADRGE
jgi:tetratricopeptide (TPR) repeat protein